MSSENNQKIAIVTGSGHRLGASIAETLIQLGYSLVLHYHSSESEALKLSEHLTSMGAAVFPFKADLTKISELNNLWEFVDGLSGHLEILINSASIMQEKKIGSISQEDFDQTMFLNLRAPLLCSQEASKRMTLGGIIINISDIASTLNWTRYPLYSISRTSLDALTRILAKDLAPNIRVNGIAPGLVLPPKGLEPSKWNMLVEKVPLRRSGVIEEITLALRFLIENKYVTGQTIVIDGGRSII